MLVYDVSGKFSEFYRYDLVLQEFEDNPALGDRIDSLEPTSTHVHYLEDLNSIVVYGRLENGDLVLYTMNPRTMSLTSHPAPGNVARNNMPIALPPLLLHAIRFTFLVAFTIMIKI